MAEIQDGRYSSGLYKKNVWMPPLHTEHKESMLCQTKGVSIYPHIFGCPLYINNTKKACFVQLRGVHMPPYIWMSPVCLDAAICLDTPPCVFGFPHMFGWPSVCLDAPICLDAPVCLGVPYVWTPPYVWMSSICLASPCTYTTQRKHASSD